MKTNASIETVTKAVNIISSKKYSGNVIFRKEPHNITKNVVRFTLKTKDAEGPGSIVTKNGQKHPKANWPVHLDVAKEIFKLEPKSHIYVDTLAGRLYNDDVPTTEKTTPETEGSSEKLIASLKYILEHKDLLEDMLEKVKS